MLAIRLRRGELLRGRVFARTSATAAAVNRCDGPWLDLAATLSPGLLELNIAAEPLERHLPSDVVDDKDALPLVRPLRALEHRLRRAGTLGQRVLDVRHSHSDLVLLAHFDVGRLGRIYRGRLEVVPNGMECRAGAVGKTAAEFQFPHFVAYPESVRSTTVHLSMNR